MKNLKLVRFVLLLFLLVTPLLGVFNSQLVHAADSESKNVATNSVMNKIRSSGEVVVGTSADYPPLEFTTSENGKTKYFGVDVELARGIAKELGVKLVIKNIKLIW